MAPSILVARELLAGGRQFRIGGCTAWVRAIFLRLKLRNAS